MTVIDAVILSPKQAAERVGCHPKTVLEALRRGELLGYQRGANCKWRIYAHDLDRWVRGEPAAAQKSA